MKNKETQVVPEEGAKKTLDYMDDAAFQEMLERWDEQDKKLRRVYLENPKRKQFFEYDFVEALWMHMIEYYGKAVGDDAIEEMLYDVTEDSRMWELVYDAAQKYADEQGWEMK